MPPSLTHKQFPIYKHLQSENLVSSNGFSLGRMHAQQKLANQKIKLHGMFEGALSYNVISGLSFFFFFFNHLLSFKYSYIFLLSFYPTYSVYTYIDIISSSVFLGDSWVYKQVIFGFLCRL